MYEAEEFLARPSDMYTIHATEDEREALRRLVASLRAGTIVLAGMDTVDSFLAGEPLEFLDLEGLEDL